MITHDDITELKRVFDDRYVLQSDCSETQESMNKKLANDDKRIDLLIHEQKQNNKLTWGILMGIIALVIESVLSGLIS